MKNRIIKISVNDIIVAPEAQSQMVTEACQREFSMKATGVCQVGDSILVSLEQIPEPNNEEYIFAPLSSYNIDEIITEISTRFYSGFSLVGGFDVKMEKWALFCLKK